MFTTTFFQKMLLVHTDHLVLFLKTSINYYSCVNIFNLQKPPHQFAPINVIFHILGWIFTVSLFFSRFHRDFRTIVDFNGNMWEKWTCFGFVITNSTNLRSTFLGGIVAMVNVCAGKNENGTTFIQFPKSSQQFQFLMTNLFRFDEPRHRWNMIVSRSKIWFEVGIFIV